MSLDKFGAFTKPFKELSILNLSNQTPADENIPVRRKRCGKNNQLDSKIYRYLSRFRNESGITRHGLRRLNIDFFGCELLPSAEFDRKKFPDSYIQRSNRILFYMGELGRRYLFAYF